MRLIIWYRNRNCWQSRLYLRHKGFCTYNGIAQPVHHDAVEIQIEAQLSQIKWYSFRRGRIFTSTVPWWVDVQWCQPLCRQDPTPWSPLHWEPYSNYHQVYLTEAINMDNRQMPLCRSTGWGARIFQFKKDKRVNANYLLVLYPGRSNDSTTVVNSKPWTKNARTDGSRMSVTMLASTLAYEAHADWSKDTAESLNRLIYLCHHCYQVDHAPTLCIIIIVLSWL